MDVMMELSCDLSRILASLALFQPLLFSHVIFSNETLLSPLSKASFFTQSSVPYDLSLIIGFKNDKYYILQVKNSILVTEPAAERFIKQCLVLCPPALETTQWLKGCLASESTQIISFILGFSPGVARCWVRCSFEASNFDIAREESLNVVPRFDTHTISLFAAALRYTMRSLLYLLATQSLSALAKPRNLFLSLPIHHTPTQAS
jgi:hypothetical protein